MNAIVLWAILVAIGGTIGTGVTRYIDNIEIGTYQNEINRYKKDIKTIQIESAAIMNEQTAKLLEKSKENLEYNQQLDKSHEQTVNSINNLHTQLANIRLQSGKQSGKSSCSALSESRNTKELVGETETDEFPTRLNGFLQPRAYDSDTNAEYAMNCYKFVVENNCGIGK